MNTIKKKIIVLEDDPDIGELVTYILTEADMEVEVYTRATAFREHLSDLHADLYLLDIMLPDGNGLEICCELGKAEKYQHIPILLMSAHTEEMGTRCKARAFIKKPFNIHEMVHLIQHSLS